MTWRDWSKYPSIKRFEKLLRRGRITTVTHENHIQEVKRFCELLGYGDPETALEDIRNIEDRETYFDDLIGTLRDKELTDTRIVNMYKSIKWWVRLNNVDVDWRDVILPRVETKVEDRAPTKEELRKILNVCNLRDKALILVTTSSGLRRNTVLTLKVGDVSFDYPDIARIMVKKHYEINGRKFRSGRKITKKRSFYMTFITPEAKKMLEQYLEHRSRLGETVTEDSPLFTSVRHKELGNFLNKQYLDVHWGNLLRRVGLTEKSGGWFVLHFHTLKKYAETQFINAGCKPSYREFWLGHSGSYLESSYFRGEEKQHLQEYRKAIPHLNVITVTPTVSKEEVRRLVAQQLKERGVISLKDIAKELKVSEETALAQLLMTRPKGERELLEAFEKETKKPKKKKAHDCQKVIQESELEDYLAQGFQYVATLPSGRILVSNDI